MTTDESNFCEPKAKQIEDNSSREETKVITTSFFQVIMDKRLINP